MVDGCTCGGQGIITTVNAEGNECYVECICAIVERRGQSMPPTVATSDLRSEHINLQLHNKTMKSLFILATQSDMNAVLKATMLRHPEMFIRITSDYEIVRVFVGKMQRKNRKDSEIAFEDVADFVGPPSLVVVRLNAMKHSNKAAADALEESLICRLDLGKPTWFFSDLDRPFTENSPAYSDTFMQSIKSSSSSIRIQPIIPKEDLSGMFNSVPIIPIPSSQPTFKTKKHVSPILTVVSDGMSMYGSGIKKSKKKDQDDGNSGI